jgi:methylmalonyl-CoA/ethylmalonyl-CoA epimerase
MIKRFFGLNIAVKDLDAAVKKYSDVLGVKPEFIKPEDFAFPGLKGVIFTVGDIRINIIASERPDTNIAKFVETRGEGVFLLSLQVTDLDKDMAGLAKKGVQFVSDKPMPYSAGRVNFGRPKSMHGVQWEFLEVKPGSKFDIKK